MNSKLTDFLYKDGSSNFQMHVYSHNAKNYEYSVFTFQIEEIYM